ncbi:MAG: PD40 domain-containing protein, partial [Bacteroidales bacterium]|nr:PD40 domain-containing protein [Bacteroidales bacterium]
MKTTRILHSILFLIFTVIISSFQVQQDHKVLFEKAKYTMETKADLTAAIDLFETLIKQYPNEKEYVAKSLLYQGLCFEKLGNQEAVKKYQQLVQNYSDQKNEVDFARERLSFLDAKLANILKQAEQHLKKGNELFGLWEYESAIEEYKKAMEPDPNSLLALNAQYCIGQTLFRQGKHESALETFKKLVEQNPESNIAPVTELMIAQVEHEMNDNTGPNNVTVSEDRNVITDSETGITYRKVKSFAGKNDIISHTGGLNLSPDSRFVVLENKVVPLDGSAPFALVNKDYVYRAVYSPKMTKAAFFADSAIWIIPVSPLTGKAIGKPLKLLEGDYDFQHVVGWSPDGEKIAFVRNDKKISDDIWTLSVLDGTLQPVTNATGYEKCPVWSPDGNTIVYDGDGYCLAPLNGGEHKKITHGGGDPFWSLDGKWLLIAQNWGLQRLYSLDSGREINFSFPKQVGRFLGFNQRNNEMLFFRSSFDDQWGLKVVSVNGGPSFKPAIYNPVYDEIWSGDSKNLIIQSDDENEKTQFKIVSLSGNDIIPVKIDVNLKESPFPFASSRDLSHLAFSVENKDGNENLYIVPFSFKEARITGPGQMIFKGWSGGAYNINFNWSIDGSKIALIHKGDIWVVPLNGEPKQITFTEENERWVKWSPDGKWISYIVPSNQTAILHCISEDGKITKIIDDKNKASNWCPDSKSLILLSENQIKIVSMDGEVLKNIIDLKELGNINISAPQYSPDGKYLAFIGYNKDEESFIYLYSFKEDKFTKLAFDVIDDYKYALRWSPDGQWLSYLTYEQEKVRPEGVLWEADF